MRYRIEHRTEYRYSKPVGQCINEAKLQPRAFTRQTPGEFSLNISPAPDDQRVRKDFFGNDVSHFSIYGAHDYLQVTATSVVTVEPDNHALQFSAAMPWSEVSPRLFTQAGIAELDARQYLLDSTLVKASSELASYAAPSFTPGRPVLEAVHDLMQRIHNDFSYDPGFTTIATPLSQVLEHRRGVCQDFAHLAIACLRAYGIPARYVSGYVETLPPPGQARLVGADASHAWFSVYIPDHGWLDFDPTNNQMPMDRHITVAWGRDFADVSPLKGIVFGSGEHQISVAVDVQNLDA